MFMIRGQYYSWMAGRYVFVHASYWERCLRDLPENARTRHKCVDAFWAGRILGDVAKKDPRLLATLYREYEGVNAYGPASAQRMLDALTRAAGWGRWADEPDGSLPKHAKFYILEEERVPLAPSTPPTPELEESYTTAPPLYQFSVRWVDELGQGFASLPLRFEYNGGSRAQSTDPAGMGRVTSVPAASASVCVADEPKLLEALKQRWSQPREDERWITAKDALLVSVRDDKLPSLFLNPGKVRMISVQPYVARVRLIGGFFDTSKAFILPTGLAGIRGIVAMYKTHANSKLLVVGHTDAEGKPAYNDTLSFERAESLKDYLSDNTDGWLKWYGNDVAQEKRWGATEDRLMLGALPDATLRSKREDVVRWFQRTRELKADGIVGPKTRKQLVTEYMALDGTSLPNDIEVMAHGCGEYFPSKAGGGAKKEPENRRVEVFFFEGRVGVLPAPGGPNSKAASREYGEWVRRSVKTEDHEMELGVTVEAVDAEGEPLSGVCLLISTPDDEHLVYTNDTGTVTVKPLARGQCTILPMDLDGSTWKPETGPVFDLGPKGQPRDHTVAQGESLVRIARGYGFSDWKKVWNDPLNESLRKKRKDPNVLLPGDVLGIPPRQLAELHRPTGGTYRIIIDPSYFFFEIRLHDHNGRPFANQDYEVRIAGEAEPRSGRTDGEGLVRVERIRATATRAELALVSCGIGWTLMLQDLVDASLDQAGASGLKARLSALGYEEGAQNSDLDDPAQGALARFQAEELGRDASQRGQWDQASADALSKRYGA